MKYQELVQTIAEQTRWPQEAVKDILDALPEVLVSMRFGEKTWTPFGYFTMRHQKPRSVTVKRNSRENKEGRFEAAVPEKAVVRLKSNHRLTVLPGDVQWRFVTSPPPKKGPPP